MPLQNEGRRIVPSLRSHHFASGPVRCVPGPFLSVIDIAVPDFHLTGLQTEHAPHRQICNQGQ